MTKAKLFIPISFLLLMVEAADPGVVAAGSAGFLYSLERSAATLHKLDADDGSTVSSVTITLEGETVTGGTGLAEHPTTGVLYAIVKLSDVDRKIRRLVTIQASTGVATLVGDPGDAFSALAFDAAGTLYGVTGDGADTSFTLYTLSTMDATPSLVRELGNGDDGETLAFNGDDGLLYHGSGVPLVNDPGGQIFESIDPSDAFSIMDVPLPDKLGEVRGITWSGALGTFLAAFEGPEADGLSEIATDGSFNAVGDLDHRAAGLAWDGSATTLYSVDRDSSALRKIDPADGSTLSSIAITLAGEDVSGGLGLALDPISGDLFALVCSGQCSLRSSRQLVTVDPVTGVATPIGGTGDRFAELAFDAAGTLYGVTGDGADTPFTLYTLSTTDGTPSFLMTLGNGSFGEAIAYNPGDGLLYHASGSVFESINLSTQMVTMIATLSISEWTALTYASLSSQFFVADLFADLYLLDVLGSYEYVGTMDHVSKGLVPLPEPATNALRLTAFSVMLLLARRSRSKRKVWALAPALEQGRYAWVGEAKRLGAAIPRGNAQASLQIEQGLPRRGDGWRSARRAGPTPRRSRERAPRRASLGSHALRDPRGPMICSTR